MTDYDKVIAIDGPGGSGKSTIAKTLAFKMGFLYVDTGAMYRALGYFLDLNKIPFISDDHLKKYLQSIVFRYGVSEDVLVEVSGMNLTEKIREHHVSELASKVSKLPFVREFLFDTQRNLVKDQICVMEGRDIATVIFPGAFCKVFLTASAKVRAKRRYDQLISMGKDTVPLNKILEDIKKRDERDSGRDVAPLKQAQDAILLDTSDLDLNHVIDQMEKIVIQRSRETGFDL